MKLVFMGALSFPLLYQYNQTSHEAYLYALYGLLLIYLALADSIMTRLNKENAELEQSFIDLLDTIARVQKSNVTISDEPDITNEVE